MEHEFSKLPWTKWDRSCSDNERISKIQFKYRNYTDSNVQIENLNQHLIRFSSHLLLKVSHNFSHDMTARLFFLKLSAQAGNYEAIEELYDMTIDPKYIHILISAAEKGNDQCAFIVGNYYFFKKQFCFKKKFNERFFFCLKHIWEKKCKKSS